MKFTYEEFKKVLEDKSIKDVVITQGNLVFVDFLRDMPEGFEFKGKIYYKVIDTKPLPEYRKLGAEECKEIAEKLIGKFNIDRTEILMIAETETERVCLVDNRVCLNGWSIVYRRK
ncbi:hypothetical protein [Alkaliphilus sp. B6464]|uniref:hypothetical protein n=1 Tax=Alkaliphilus sp. B6464 TaxID=2731219 RepID=UPI001BA710BE|nr:hypothetical protein [Alkaliphilus sp. B6464]QUH21818.1 hypothetical protein HYG84_17940 [Alkaliphilus sp. B6464]